MVEPAPKIDKRTALDVEEQVRLLLAKYVPDQFSDPQNPDKPRQLHGISAALVKIFSRFSEIIIQRLNQVPDKNFLAFLDLLGASRLPPQPARVPLTFSLAAGSVLDAVVPAGTQVAAPPAEGQSEPVIFETERELVVTAAQLESIFVRDPEQDTWSDRSTWLTPDDSTSGFVFRGDRPIEHSLYLACEDLFTLAVPKTVTLTIQSSEAGKLAKLPLIWSYWDGQDWQPLSAQLNYIVNGLTVIFTNDRRQVSITAGEAVDNQGHKIQLAQVQSVNLQNYIQQAVLLTISYDEKNPNTPQILTFLETEVHKYPLGVYIRLARLVIDSEGLISQSVTSSTPTETEQQWQISIAKCPVPSKRSLDGITASWMKVKLNQPWPSGSTLLPSITAISASVHVQRDNLLPDLAFNNTLPLDLTKDFYPFGETPRLSDTLYFASQEVFSKATTTVTVNITLNETVPVNTEGGIDLAWEAWDGSTWQPLAVSSGNPSPAKFTQSGSVTFTLPSQMGLREENGKTNYWIRVRIVGGNYGVGTVSNQPVTFTTLTQASQNIENRGRLTVNSVRGFMPDDRIQIAAGSNTQESQVIQSVDISGKTLALTTALQNTHPVGTGVWLVNNAALLPPLVKSLKLSYTYKLNNQPLSACKKYNYFTYENCLNLAFSPFQSPKESKPTLYFGFTLPQNRSNFPNRSLSLFVRLTDLKYGEKFVPLDPVHSRQFGATGETVKHQLLVTNDTPHSVTWIVIILGNTWKTDTPSSITLDGYEAKSLEVGITIPPSLNQQQSDRAFLRLISPDHSDVIYSTTLETFVGQEQPSTKQIHLSWEYWNGQNWSKFSVEDGTENFTRSGLIQFLLPTDFQPKAEFEYSARYWLRVQWEDGNYSIEPRLQRVLLNTTMAAQTVTIRNEVLGSSDGSENQKFRTTQAPVLKGQKLEVQEVEMPAVEEQKIIKQEEGENAIATTLDATGRPQEIWVRWHEVPDFYGSSPRDRHYILDRLTGEIQFGNGSNGLIPPVGTGNLRMAYYQTGGGTVGNQPAGTIVQLKTTVPYVDKVTNTEAAAGGAEAESLDSLRDREPRKLRHNNRAVTLEDYEDLARLASPEVARAKCIPLLNLQNNNGLDVQNPAGQTPKAPGQVGMIIVPRSTEAKPLPTVELIRRVQDYLEANSVPTVTISVVGPLYISVSVTTEIAVTSPEGASAVKQSVEQKLASFLHPLTGGLDGRGWDFGREPHKSDFYALIEAIPGVNYVRTLNVTPPPYPDGVRETGRFLVYSGNHEINLFF